MRDRLPPELESLLEAERRAPAPSAEAQARVGRRLEASLGLAAAAGVAAVAGKASAATSAAGKAIALKLVLGAVGAVLVVGGGVSYFALHKNPAPRTLSAAAVKPAAPAAPPLALAPPLEFAPTTIEAPAQARPRQRPRPDELASEQAFIEEARAALVGGAPSRAIQLLAQHERRFPSGQMGEVRDSLRIQALVSAGQPAAAQARAAEFRRRFPHSLFLPAVDASLAAQP